MLWKASGIYSRVDQMGDRINDLASRNFERIYPEVKKRKKHDKEQER